MRPTHFLRKILETGEVESVPFSASHYHEAGVPASISAGMPILEAYQLTNKWNVNQSDQRFIYALAD